MFKTFFFRLIRSILKKYTIKLIYIWGILWKQSYEVMFFAWLLFYNNNNNLFSKNVYWFRSI